MSQPCYHPDMPRQACVILSEERRMIARRGREEAIGALVTQGMNRRDAARMYDAPAAAADEPEE